MVCKSVFYTCTLELQTYIEIGIFIWLSMLSWGTVFQKLDFAHEKSDSKDQ